MNTPKWTREQVEAAIEGNDFQYQNISLPYGIETGGPDRTYTAKSIFSKRIDGKTVFDLGCYLGFFCFYAEELGAVKVVGADIDSENIRKARLLADIKESGAEFRVFNIETDAVPGHFDYVLCLNVLHHLRNPISAIEKLIAATREILVLELAGFSKRDRIKNHIPLPLATLLNRLPLLFIARSSAQTFFMTAEAIKVLLLEKRFDFARVDIVSGGQKGRPILIARKRRIKTLLVVAGMQASGKSTLIDQLRTGQAKNVASALSIDNQENWSVAKLNELAKNPEADMGNVMLHYNISAHYLYGDLYQHSNALSDIMSVAENVKIITLVTTRERLLEQFTRARLARDELSGSNHKKTKMRKLLKLFNNPRFLDGLYSEWHSFVKASGKSAFTVTHDGGEYEIEVG